jgi:branched-chain amino acid transport system permease protein
MFRLGHLSGVIAAAALVAALAAFTNDFHGRVLFMIGVNYIAAAGLNVLVGYAGQKSLGHAGLFGVGAYTVALGTTQWGLDPWTALATACVVGGLFGLIIAAPAVRVSGPSLAMVTIGFGIVVEKVVTEWTDVFGGQAGIYGIAGPTIGGRALNSREWVWFVLVLSILTHLALRSLLIGRWGRAFRAVQFAEPAAASAGISPRRIKTLAFVISAVTCALAGALVAMQNQYINSDFVNFNLSIFLLVLVLFGGSGSIYGPVLGAVAVTIIGAWVARWPALEHFVYGALLLFALFMMPRGLAGAIEALCRRLGIGRKESLEVSPAEPLRSRTLRAPLGGAGPLLKAEGLFKAYGGITPTRNVNFAIDEGPIHSLIGPNGAGKTTLLNILSGHVRADAGSIQFAGCDLTRLSPDRVAALGVARTFQNLRLFGSMSVVDTILVGAHRHIRAGIFSALLGTRGNRAAERDARARVDALLAEFNLADRTNDSAATLPYGLQRRVEIARALAAEPTLLLLDEPAAGLNHHEAVALGVLLKKISQLGVTVLLIEHHMDLVMSVSKHVIVLDYGEKIADGTPDSIRRDPTVIAAYLGAEETPPQPRAVAVD